MNSDVLKEYAEKGLEGIKDRLDGKWDSFTEVQRDSAKRAAERYLGLKVKQAGGEDVSIELKFVETTIGEFEVAAKIAISDIFFEEMKKAAEALGSFLSGIAKGLL